MLSKQISEINREDIEGLIRDRVPEGRNLEYKRDLPEGKDEAKVKFLRSVTGMANADGGLIIFGISESKEESSGVSVAENVFGVKPQAGTEVNVRFDEIIRNGTDPTLVGHESKQVEMGDGKSVWVLSVPQSWNAPHRVSLNKHARFYLRQSASNVEMDVVMLRDAFSQRARVEEQLMSFRKNRIDDLINSSAGFRLGVRSALVIHVLPTQAVFRDFRIDLALARRAPENLEIQSQLIPEPSRFNFDGVFRGNQNNKQQIFRNGIIEFVYSPLVGEKDNGQKYVDADYLRTFTYMSVGLSLCLQRRVNITGSVWVGVALLGVEGSELMSDKGRFPEEWLLAQKQTADRPFLTAEPELLEDIAVVEIPVSNSEDAGPTFIKSYDLAKKVLTNTFHSFWNAYGYERSKREDLTL